MAENPSTAVVDQPTMSLDDAVYYRDEQVTLYKGDNQEILRLMAENSVDVVVTSPPYNTGMVGNEKVKASGFRKEHAMAKNLTKMTSGYADTIPEEEYQNQQVAILDAIGQVLHPSGSLFYNHKIRWREKRLIHPLDWVRRSVLNLRMEIVWDRGVGLTLNARRFYDQDERIYWLYKNDWTWNQEAVGHGSVWRISPQAFKEHACVFPEALVARCLDGVAKPGMVVMDPYAGSGTTLVVARKFGCKAIGIERDPKYCDVIVERLSQQVLPFDVEEATLL
jgi:DNA modification methylase